MMPWTFTQDRPIFQQIIDQLKLMIITGIYAPGEKLESVRELAQKASVNPNTMQRALAELERSELIFSVRTNGRFITDNAELIKKTKESMAREVIIEFLDKMQKYGCTTEKSIELIKTIAKEENL